MVRINKTNMEATRKYICGMSLDTFGIRKYSLTITEGEHKGKVIFEEIYTPRKKNGEWREGQVSFYTDDSPQFKTMKEMLEWLEKQK